MVNALEKPYNDRLIELLFTPHNIQMATRRDILFKEAIYRIQERERLGLSSANIYAYIQWQGNNSYDHLDMETIRKLSWIEFIEDNYEPTLMGKPHPNQYRKYNKALTWKEIEEIEDITK